MIAQILSDHTFWLYFIVNISAVFTACLLSWDWYRLPERPDSIYIYIWLLMWGIWINMDFLIYGRSLHFTSKIRRNEFIQGCFWAVRVYPVAIATVSMAIHLIYRRTTGRKGSPFGIDFLIKIINKIGRNI